MIGDCGFRCLGFLGLGVFLTVRIWILGVGLLRPILASH